MIAPSEFRPTPPVQYEWLVRREDGIAHAFAMTGPAWHFSRCTRVRFTAGLETPGPDAERCDDCDLLVDGAPGEISEAWGS